MCTLNRKKEEASFILCESKRLSPLHPLPSPLGDLRRGRAGVFVEMKKRAEEKKERRRRSECHHVSG
jgi:hypothetical protein